MRHSLKISALYGRVTVIAWVLILYWGLSKCYEKVVAPVYNFGGFALEPKSSAIVEYVLISLLALFLPLEIRSAKQMFFWMSAIFLLIPATVLEVFQNKELVFLLLMYAATFYVAGLVAFVGALFPACKKAQVRLRGFRPLVRFVLLFVLIVLVGLWVQSPGIKTFDFSDVYAYRFEFNDTVTFPFDYLVPITGNTLSALLMAYAVATRRYALAVFVICFGIVLFGLTTHKVFAFVPIFALVWTLLVRFRYGLHVLLFGIVLLVVLTLAAKSDISILGNSFANRLMFIPAQIHFEYMETFSSIGFQFWAESKMGLGLAKSNLPMPAVNYIAERMTGDPAIGANTGWIANAFMNAGVAGIFVYGSLIAILLLAIDRWASRYSPEFVLGVFSIFMLSIVNSMDLLVAVVTGGAGVSFLVFFVADKFSLGNNPKRVIASKIGVCDTEVAQ